MISRIKLFEQEAAARLPGFLYSFNIADLKRRNSHLGHAVGDQDIAELDRLLRVAVAPDVLMERTGGERWLMLSRQNANERIQGLLDQYKRSDPFVSGWRVRASRDGKEKTGERSVATQIMRAVRCLYAEVTIPEDLAAAIAQLAENDWNLPVNRVLRLSDIAALPRQKWQCVAEYPAENPACPFCGGKSFAWEDGDDSAYSGDGTCKGCGAEISIRDFV